MNNYLGREGVLDDTKPTLREEEAKKLINNDILIQQNKKAFYKQVENVGYKHKVTLKELKKLLNIRGYIIGYPTRFKQVYNAQNSLDFELKKESEFKRELKQFIYDYFNMNKYDCSNIENWNTR